MPISTRNTGERGRVLMIILIVLVVLGLGIFGLGKCVIATLQTEVAKHLRTNPVVLEQIGEIQSLTLDLSATGKLDDEDALVFDIKGSKGEGVITTEIGDPDDGEELVVRGELKMKDGRTFALVPSPPDAGKPDAGTPDADTPDAARPDGSKAGPAKAPASGK